MTRAGLWGVLAALSGIVAAILAGGQAAVALPVLVGATVTRAGGDAAGTACVGLALATTLLPLGHGRRPPSELPAVLAAADRALLACAGGWLVLLVLGIGFRTAEAYGRPIDALTGDQLRTFAVEVAAGRGLLLTAACAAAVAVCGALRLRHPDAVPVRLVLVAGLLGVMAPTVTGHAGTAPDHELAVVTVAVHVAAAALWVGGLGAVLLLAAPRPRLLDAVLPRYSTLAGGCLAAVTVSGVLNAALRVPSWAALVTTGYGGLVLVKAACVVALAGLGLLARRRLAARRLPVLRWAGVEAALMAMTIGVAAALTQTG